MKKIIVTCFIIIVLMVSCKKNTEENYNISFAANGANTTYSGTVTAQSSFAGGFTTLAIFGANSIGANKNYFSINMNNIPGGVPFSTTSYIDTAADYTIAATYHNGSVQFEAGKAVAEDAATSSITIANHFMLVITENNGEFVKGTFSGDFFHDGNVTTGTKITVTNGKFFAKYQ